MNNDIIKFLNIEDEDILIKGIEAHGNTKEINIEKVLKPDTVLHVILRCILTGNISVPLIIQYCKMGISLN